MVIIKMTPSGVVQSLRDQDCGKDRAEVEGGPEGRAGFIGGVGAHGRAACLAAAVCQRTRGQEDKSLEVSRPRFKLQLCHFPPDTCPEWLYKYWVEKKEKKRQKMGYILLANNH